MGLLHKAGSDTGQHIRPNTIDGGEQFRRKAYIIEIKPDNRRTNAAPSQVISESSLKTNSPTASLSRK